MRHYADRGNGLVALLEFYEFHTLSVTALRIACISDGETYGDATLVDNHEVFVARYTLHCHEFTRLVGYVKRDDALRATLRQAIVLHNGALAVAVLADYHDGLILRVVDAYHTYYLILAVSKAHTDNARCHTAHHADVGLIEANGTTVAGSQDEFVVAVSEHYVYYLVALSDVDSSDALATRTRVVEE